MKAISYKMKILNKFFRPKEAIESCNYSEFALRL